jgi:hypothetical protein
MKSTKWILIAAVLFACLSVKNINHSHAASAPIKQNTALVTKEDDFELDFLTTVYSEDKFSSPAEYPPSYCPDGMIEISGDYCQFAKEICLKWIDADNKYPYMCEKFEYPTKCVSKTTHMTFCIDKYEAQTSRDEIP